MEGLGTALRKLSEGLDAGVQWHYDAVGETFRPRFFPVAQLLLSKGASSIRAISAATGVSHSAVSQTVAEMRKAGLVEGSAGQDGRERIIALTDAGVQTCNRLQPLWKAVACAASALDTELSMPLSKLLREVSERLNAEDFASRIDRQLQGDCS